MTETKKILGLRIQEIRKNHGLKQTQLAEIVGIDSKHMSKIECGHCYPSFDLLDKIALALNVKPSEMLKTEHLKEKRILIAELVELLNNADDKKIQISYKILKDILE